MRRGAFGIKILNSDPGQVAGRGGRLHEIPFLFVCGGPILLLFKVRQNGVDIGRVLNDRGKDLSTHRRLFFNAKRTQRSSFILRGTIAGLFISNLVRPVLNLFIAAVIGVAINLRRVSVTVGRVPGLLCTWVVRPKVDRRFKHPATLQDKRGVRNVTRLHNHRLTLIRIITIALICRSSVNRFRGTALSTLRFIAHTNRLSRRRGIRRKVANHLTLTSASHFRGCLIRANHLARSSKLTHLTDRATWQTNKEAKAGREIKVSKGFLRTNLIARSAPLTTLATKISNRCDRFATMFLGRVGSRDVSTHAFPNSKSATSACARKAPQVERALLGSLLYRGLVIKVHTFRRDSDLSRRYRVPLRSSLRVVKDQRETVARASTLRVEVRSKELDCAAICRRPFVFFTVFQVFRSFFTSLFIAFAMVVFFKRTKSFMVGGVHKMLFALFECFT